ncbi:MAG: hypothetical protein J6Y92_09715 [Lentisphaeria bacterium]|nr:hypothetical protein [Lentisphaeria bacterium]
MLDVSLSFLERVLGGTYDFTYGVASGFFYVRMLPRAHNRTHQGHPMLLSDCPVKSQAISAGNLFFRRALMYFSVKRPPQTQSEQNTTSGQETESFASKRKGFAYNKIFFFLISALSMFMGGAIYLIWRPPTLLMFSWCRRIGIYEFVMQMRLSLAFMKEYLPTWFIYSLPQALWFFSGLCCIHSIWNHKTGAHERFWITTIIVFSLLIEILQLFHVFSGTCDIVDLVLILVFYLIFELSTKLINGENNVKK